MAMIFGSVMSGISYTSMIKASQLIGRNDSKGVKKLAERTLLLNFTCIQSIYLMLWMFPGTFFSYYTQDAFVQQQMLTVLLPYFFMNCFDSIQFMASQLYKALEMGSWVCIVCLSSYYFAGLGSMLLLGLVVESKLLCAWWGFTIGLAVADLCFILRYRRLDLVKLVEKLHLDMKAQEETQIEMTRV
jgi:Na+-driven multidrug efflux pump